MLDVAKEWETYEQVAVYLISKFANEFGLELVEGKQNILGLRSNSEWTIEGKGIIKGKEKFIIVECKRYTTSKLKQETIGGLAYRILNTGAAGGIIVTPIGLQEGAKKIANSENIITVILDKDSSPTEYIMKFLNQINVGIGGNLAFNGNLYNK